MKCVYFAEAVGTTTLKVGQAEDVARRIKEIQVGCPFELRVIGSVTTDIVTEREMKRSFNQFHIRGEWFEHSMVVKRVIAMLLSGDKVRIGAVRRWIEGEHRGSSTGKAKVRGRPKKNPRKLRTDYMEVRVSLEDKQLFYEAAEVAGLTFSEWARSGLRQECRTVLEEAGRPVPFLSKHQAVKGKNR